MPPVVGAKYASKKNVLSFSLSPIAINVGLRRREQKKLKGGENMDIFTAINVIMLPCIRNTIAKKFAKKSLHVTYFTHHHKATTTTSERLLRFQKFRCNN